MSSDSCTEQSKEAHQTYLPAFSFVQTTTSYDALGRVTEVRRKGASALGLPAWVNGPDTPDAAGGAPEPGALPPSPSQGLILADPPDPAASLAELGYKEALEQYSRQIVAAGLAQSQGRIGEASRLLGLSPKAVQAKLKEFLT